jgi:hypothetical protein
MRHGCSKAVRWGRARGVDVGDRDCVVSATWSGEGVCCYATMMSGEPDAGELLRASVPHLVPERMVEIASAQAGCPVAAYVLDVEGSFAVRLAGDGERFPERIRAPVGVGPEIIPEALSRLRGW